MKVCVEYKSYVTYSSWITELHPIEVLILSVHLLPKVKLLGIFLDRGRFNFVDQSAFIAIE